LPSRENNNSSNHAVSNAEATRNQKQKVIRMQPILGNIILETFLHGGLIMWPILVAALAAIAVLSERIVWWIAQSRRRDPRTLAQVLTNVEKGDLARAIVVSTGSKDPVVKMIHHGLQNYPRALSEAMHVVAVDEVEKAGRFLGVLDTMITLAPLLGLLGTVTGIMGSFASIGGSELAVEKVTGGIGEALIATATGLGVAIMSLVPYNWFNRRSSRLAIQLQKVASHLEGLVKRYEDRFVLDPEKVQSQQITA
jgi:biopolymer transport protein ExbB